MATSEDEALEALERACFVSGVVPLAVLVKNHRGGRCDAMVVTKDVTWAQLTALAEALDTRNINFKKSGEHVLPGRQTLNVTAARVG